jgi:hypothetical protein
MAGHEGTRCVAAPLRDNRQGRRPNQRLKLAAGTCGNEFFFVSTPQPRREPPVEQSA